MNEKEIKENVEKAKTKWQKVKGWLLRFCKWFLKTFGLFLIFAIPIYLIGCKYVGFNFFNQ